MSERWLTQGYCLGYVQHCQRAVRHLPVLLARARVHARRTTIPFLRNTPEESDALQTPLQTSRESSLSGRNKHHFQDKSHHPGRNVAHRCVSHPWGFTVSFVHSLTLLTFREISANNTVNHRSGNNGRNHREYTGFEHYSHCSERFLCPPTVKRVFGRHTGAA